MPIGDGHILGGVITQLIKEGVHDAATAPNNSLKPGVEATNVANIVVEAVKADPLVKNALNEENPVQSRVGLGGFGVVLVAVGMLLNMLLPLNETWNQIVAGTFDWTAFGGYLAIISSAAFSLYGRFKSGLKPLFWKFFQGKKPS